MDNDLELTQLQVQRYEAVRRHDWREVRRIDAQIIYLVENQWIKQHESEVLVNQLWPGARVQG